MDSKIKKIENIVILKNEEKEKINDNIKAFKNKIKQNDIDEIDNWDNYKKGNKKNHQKLSINIINKPRYKNLKRDFIVKYKKKLTINLIKNIKNQWIGIKKNYNIILKNKIEIKNNFMFLLNMYKAINYKKIDLIKKKKYFKLNKIVVIILDLKSLKSKIIVMDNNKTIFYISNGVIFKKLQLKNKKYKKSEKLTYLIIKSMVVSLNFFKKYNNMIINIKGVKNNINNYITYINKNLKNFQGNYIYLNSNKISRNKFFKIKKLKAIKKKTEEKNYKI